MLTSNVVGNWCQSLCVCVCVWSIKLFDLNPFIINPLRRRRADRYIESQRVMDREIIKTKNKKDGQKTTNYFFLTLTNRKQTNEQKKTK